MKNTKIDVIATTISGSIKDWGKVKQIVPLFEKKGFTNVKLYEVDSHLAARKKTCECIEKGTRTIISAGGSGTFNAVLEGCCDSQVGLQEIQLGFLRKGSADLIGKALGMPDEIGKAIDTFAHSIENKTVVDCDVLLAQTPFHDSIDRHFVGYGGAEIFGEIPYFTENRYMKYYKGILSQFFGDLGPFFVGSMLSCLRKQIRSIQSSQKKWNIYVDDNQVASGYYQVFILVNGDLGKDLPFAKGAPLGSGEFYLFALRDMGLGKLAPQFKKTWDASILKNPHKLGFEKYIIKDSLRLEPDISRIFEINVDGATMYCKKEALFKICDTIKLIASKQ